MKDTIRCRTSNIFPKDLEDILLKNPEIDEGAVVPVSHELDYERPFVFVKLAQGAKVDSVHIFS